MSSTDSSYTDIIVQACFIQTYRNINEPKLCDVVNIVDLYR